MDERILGGGLCKRERKKKEILFSFALRCEEEPEAAKGKERCKRQPEM